MANTQTDSITLVSAADLSAVANQFKIVKITANRTVNLTSVAGELAVGVLANKPALGQPAEIYTGPVVKVVLGATLAAGAQYMAGADGRAVAATATNVALGQIVVGGVANDIREATFAPFGKI